MKLAPQPHLSDYLAEHVKEGVIDFSLRAQLDTKGNVTFYIHPAQVSGRTEDYWLQPGKVEVMNLRGMNALIEAAMRSKPTPLSDDPHSAAVFNLHRQRQGLR